MSSDTQLTPMMAQYRRIKGELPLDALLLFRLGDFYEMFFEDAQAGAQLLHVALTKRGVVPMCGIPYHAANTYIARLLKAGRKVAICDQMEDARPGQLVKREVTQILSPGTHLDDRMLNAERNNFLAAVCSLNSRFGLALVDLSTGDFKATELDSEAALLSELERLRPAEIVFPSEASALRGLLTNRFAVLNGYDDWVFAPETAQFTVREHFKVSSLDGFGLRDRPSAIGAAGAVLHYLSHHLRRDVAHLTRLSCYECRDYLVLDATSIRHLEILEPLHRDAPRTAALYGAINRTVTPMGARRLRDWLTQPLAAAEPIRRRQEAVRTWLEHSEALERFRQHLTEVRDLERTLSRLSVGPGNGRDLVALRVALERVPQLRATLLALPRPTPNSSLSGFRELLTDVAAKDPSMAERTMHIPNSPVEPGPAGMTKLPPLHGELSAPSTLQLSPAKPAPDSACGGAALREESAVPLLAELSGQLCDCPDLVELLARAIVEDPPLAVKEGGMIRDGFDSNLDELRLATRDGKDWIAKLQQQEIETTGIPSLKVRFNSVFGYYIEVTKTHLEKVPPHYIRKQTIAGGERYFTQALKEMESKILGAEERSIKLEYELFLRVREAVIARLAEIQQTAQALAQLDVLASFAETARLFDYCCPDVAQEGVLRIQDGRHPVLDQVLAEERFVPNDTELDLTSQQIALITGPNMAGKSTYIRQVALMVLLAQTGSFVPARSARVDLVDRIFTRIGASDDLARGQSTFMVEMSETANILNNATRNSLIILDEIGRGTSTFDGLSLAWSIVEFLHNQVGAKTLFATHYHELTELAGRLQRLRNFNVAVREWNDQIIFLRKIVAGGTDKSYGIQVARLAGVPKTVLTRAKEILSNLEESELTPEGKVRPMRRHRAEREKLQQLAPPPQLDLFG